MTTTLREATELDSGHPLLAFAHALREAVETDTQLTNPIPRRVAD